MLFGRYCRSKPVGVLAGPALQGAARIAEVDLEPSLSGQFGMARHLLPLVIGQGLVHWWSEAIEFAAVTRRGGGEGGGVIVYFVQQHQARVAFNQDSHYR